MRTAYRKLGGRAILLAALCLSGSPAVVAQVGSRDPTLQKPHGGNAIFVRPRTGSYRRCGGSCLKSGAQMWFCRRSQVCALDCNTSPPAMHCHDP